ncbi:MAG: hypothetical protein MJA82_06265 [Clostridia bacterium]|nr:hypothetical protein [Clostridia bacterium]
MYKQYVSVSSSELAQQRFNDSIRELILTGFRTVPIWKVDLAVPIAEESFKKREYYENLHGICLETRDYSLNWRLGGHEHKIELWLLDTGEFIVTRRYSNSVSNVIRRDILLRKVDPFKKFNCRNISIEWDIEKICNIILGENEELLIA